MSSKSPNSPSTPPTPHSSSGHHGNKSGITLGLISLCVALIALSRWEWALRWFISGTPFLSICLIIGSKTDDRVLPIIPLWTLLATLNLAYAIAATSWLLFWVFTFGIYPCIFLTCLFQFDLVSRFVRRTLRKALRELQFVHDTIALFDIPALEIDVDVDGLMVVRGLTIQLSSLTIIAHGIEVGIKLADDIELAISTEKVVIYLFRKIEISDCYANIKGGRPEMTFGDVETVEGEDEDGDAVMVEATPLLQAAHSKAACDRPKMVKMKSRLTNGIDVEGAGVMAGLRSMRRLSPEDEHALSYYQETVKSINESNTIYQSRRKITKKESDIDQGIDDCESTRASICSDMQHAPSVPHPPKRSIKVTTLQNLSKPGTRKFLHRLPMLLRLILNPIAYFHPVSINSITAGGSGQWISYLLIAYLFKNYADDNRQLKKLEHRILSWLADANFVFELINIKGVASVPFNSNYDIQALLKFSEISAYRTLEAGGETEQVIRLGGADANFTIPSFLLPHHEHLLPPKPSAESLAPLEKAVLESDGPKEVQAKAELENAKKDLTNVGISAHVQLPAIFSQELLNFIAALVKATKVVEMEKDPGALEASKIHGFKDFGQALSKGMKDGMKKTVVDGIISDKWIAKMVGKITKKLEEAQGDLGYSGDIPVELEKYRLPDGHPELNKILV